MMEGVSADFAPPRRAPRVNRGLVISVAGLVTSVLIAVLTVLPAPYAIGAPGPTFDTLGDIDGKPLVAIDGAPTYESSGELRLTTVSVSKAGDRPFTLGRVLRGWASPAEYVVPQEAVFGNPGEEQAAEQEAQAQWITSQESATVSALEALGHPVPATMRVAGTIDGTGAVGKLIVDDVVIAVDGVDVISYSDVSRAMDAHAPGDEVTVTVTRGADTVTESIVTIDDGSGGALLGVWLDPVFDLPISVTVLIDSVGGPSAGTMFALGIMDKLTESDELAGAKVAGTGAISADGDVEPIGGIAMKMWGAVNSGADFFLAPVENCDEVVGRIPPGLSVFSIDTLSDAYVAIERIGAKDTSKLPTC